MSLRIGIDVGGTNTDAVLMRGNDVIAKIKTPTTEDVTSGITTALNHVLGVSNTKTSEIAGVMIGTTHFTNAVVERRRLQPTAAVRLGLPATAALPPMVDWPDDLADTLGRHTYLCHGGHEFDGREISKFDPDEIQGGSSRHQSQGHPGHRGFFGLFSRQSGHGEASRRDSGGGGAGLLGHSFQ